jgi:hypothetical protein
MANTATKTARTLQASASNAAGGTTTGSALNLTTAFGGVVTAKVTPAGTLGVGCTFRLQISGDGSSWKLFSEQLSGLVSGTDYEFIVDVPPGVMYLRSVFTGNTTSAATVEAFFQEFTSIS